MTHSRRAVHLVEGTPDDGPADTTLDRAEFMDVGVLERTEGETETTTR